MGPRIRFGKLTEFFGQITITYQYIQPKRLLEFVIIEMKINKMVANILSLE